MRERIYLSLLLLFSMCVPVLAYPVHGVTGSMGDRKQTMNVKDGVVLWWTRYGVASNVVEVHLFARKLSPDELRSFAENVGPAGDLGRALDSKRSANSALDSARMILQVFYPGPVRDLSQGMSPHGAAMWLPGPGSLSSAELGGVLKLSGPLRQGAKIEAEGSGTNSHGIRWGVRGALPLIILSSK
ncbi:MAG: hypothetical protein U0931_13405 [Vulcanimicrobiota bacterium]